MIWHARLTNHRNTWVAKQGNHNYTITYAAGYYALCYRLTGDERSSSLGQYPTDAHAKDAAQDHAEGRVA